MSDEVQASPADQGFEAVLPPLLSPDAVRLVVAGAQAEIEGSKGIRAGAEIVKLFQIDSTLDWQIKADLELRKAITTAEILDLLAPRLDGVSWIDIIDPPEAYGIRATYSGKLIDYDKLSEHCVDLPLAPTMSDQKTRFKDNSDNS